MYTQHMYIDGQLIVSDQKHLIINPATRKHVCEIYSATKNEAEMALLSAKGFEIEWANTDINERIDWMQKIKKEIIKNEETLRNCVHYETGKTWKDTEEDFKLLVDSLDYYSKNITNYLNPEIIKDTDYTHKIKKSPVGVVVAYLAWNFPLLNIGYKLGPAMASGCPIIIKPSSKTPLSAYAVGKICHDIGLPKGAVHILAGNDRELGNYLSSSTVPALITLIGSTQTGIDVISNSATSIKRYSMELGGDAPYIVFADADLDAAADILTAIKFTNAGQICVSANRVLVEKSVLDCFTTKLLNRIANIVVGWERESNANMGALIDVAAKERVHRLVVDALEKGATLQCGGNINQYEEGAFYPPTLLTNISDKMEIFRNEIFGPVIAISTFDDENDVVKTANNTLAGLASYIFTEDKEKATRVSNELSFGEIHVNGIKYSIELPHSGIKQSGIGCDCSLHALQEYFSIKRLSIKN
ncbi:NAD-dependent succinate-semialdehyde dehydrogenase [Vibrio panuliri]|uniref:NAD-dependent succinate-semialdehyde dehydrogenase n=1 Tax=Vibrio panuliri TaxID=1381081 RepID=A0A1Q9HDZ8_9VIBR|nr:aldehyde dehydrogenase family protein [Vibrio panuliri]OLQ87921.1 NAD-dependent succinate-semialdehyde dehydrogenase [Vibrio panuliri]